MLLASNANFTTWKQSNSRMVQSRELFLTANPYFFRHIGIYFFNWYDSGLDIAIFPNTNCETTANQSLSVFTTYFCWYYFFVFNFCFALTLLKFFKERCLWMAFFYLVALPLWPTASVPINGIPIKFIWKWLVMMQMLWVYIFCFSNIFKRTNFKTIYLLNQMSFLFL
jgi:hypothetical protein